MGRESAENRQRREALRQASGARMLQGSAAEGWHPVNEVNRPGPRQGAAGPWGAVMGGIGLDVLNHDVEVTP